MDSKEQNNLIIDVNKLQAYLEMACLFEDSYFKIFMQNKTYKPAQFILRTILNNPFLVVQNITVQKVINNIGGREVSLDFYCEQIDDNGKVIKRFNIEIQRAINGAIPQRARFYSSSLDSASLAKKGKFKELTENYVIFIAEKDIFKKQQALYNIQRYIEFTDEHGNIIDYKPFGDGSKIIYLNGEYKNTSNELGKIIHDFHCVKSTEMLCEELKKPAEYLKNKKKGDNEMFELYNFLTDESQEKIKKQLEEAESRGKIEGKIEGERLGMINTIINNIKSLMTNLHLTAENAINALNIPKEEQEFYLSQLQPNTP